MRIDRNAFAVVVLCVTLGLGGCDENADVIVVAGDGAGGGGGQGTGGIAGESGAAGMAGDGGPDGSAAGGAAGQGAPVWAGAALFNSTIALNLWQALFYSIQQSDPNLRCYTHDIDNCTILDCRTSVYGLVPGIESVSAGPVTFSNGSAADVVLQPDGNGFYTSKSGYDSRWAVGDTVHISAPGDALPGFDVDAVLPGPIDTLAPDLEGIAGGGTLHMTRAEAFTQTWEPVDGEVVVELLESPTSAFSGSTTDVLDLQCRFPGSDGTGVVPASVMSLFEGGMPVTLLCSATVNRTLEPLGNRTLVTFGVNGICRDIIFDEPDAGTGDAAP